MLRPCCEKCNYNCENCFYADDCGVWMDNPSIPIPMYELHISVTLGLCKGRHDMPVDGYVFDEIPEPTNTAALEKEAYRSIFKYATERSWTTTGDIGSGLTVNLYVTGLTTALIAVLNVCRKNNIKVMLWHYDRETGHYFSQEVK